VWRLRATLGDEAEREEKGTIGEDGTHGGGKQQKSDARGPLQDKSTPLSEEKTSSLFLGVIGYKLKPCIRGEKPTRSFMAELFSSKMKYVLSILTLLIACICPSHTLAAGPDLEAITERAFGV